uniref:Small ribosomal subunit protein uS8c n=1 Tax=Pedinomonas tuberculata TaxID=160064 RepID=A0A097KL93_9CHLO|nr:ribosomal protein S8 [Pedinomonas tuberculata]AIT93941.1 ribosomal protein S8 [Pedinomonas tuberculata]
MLNDTISDLLTRVRNAILVKSQNVLVQKTNTAKEICQILLREGFIESFADSTTGLIEIRLKYLGRERKSCITNLKRISKPGLRVYSNSKDIPQILGGLGIVILSTSNGLMTDKEAKAKKVGGELLCSIW